MPYCSRCHSEEVPTARDVCSTCIEEIISEVAQQKDNRYAEAKKIIDDPSYISKTLTLARFVSGLREKDARAILRQLLMDPNPYIRSALIRCGGGRKKSGRKPKGEQALYQVVYNLRKSGLSFGQIARRIWDDASKDRQARAHYNQALKRGFPRIKLPSTKK
jgi:hypothetical protein